MSMFEVEFEKLQQNKVLVVLRSCGSQWQKSFIKSLERGRAVVDLAVPDCQGASFELSGRLHS